MRTSRRDPVIRMLAVDRHVLDMRGVLHPPQLRGTCNSRKRAEVRTLTPSGIESSTGPATRESLAGPSENPRHRWKRVPRRGTVPVARLARRPDVYQVTPLG